MGRPDFWMQPDRHAALARLALMDRVRAAAATAAALRGRLSRGTERTGRHSRELVARLALQLHLLEQGIRDALEAAPIEVALLVEPALEKSGEHQATRAWCQQVLDMYRAWGSGRHMQTAEIADGNGRNLPWLIISGFGAHRVLAQEVGLHVSEADEEGATRLAARVRLAVAPLGDPPADRLRAALTEAFARGPQPHAVVRRYRARPSPLVRDMGRGWRSGKLDAVLRGDFDLIGASLSLRSPS
jgi:ATP-dependent Clp protease ATP-binding subunit ClpC